MKSALHVTLGGALGALLMGATVWGLGLSNHTQATRLDALGRDLLIGASIEAIGYLERGDQEAAELVLASSVNDQIRVLRRSKDHASLQPRIKEWSKAMKETNRKLGMDGDL